MPNKTDRLTHLDDAGQAHIVDISEKAITTRVATATSCLRMQPETLSAIVADDLPKGDVMAVARVAGIQAAKKCAELIPLCHPLPLSSVEIDLQPDQDLPGEDHGYLQGHRSDRHRNGGLNGGLSGGIGSL